VGPVSGAFCLLSLARLSVGPRRRDGLAGLRGRFVPEAGKELGFGFPVEGGFCAALFTAGGRVRREPPRGVPRGVPVEGGTSSCSSSLSSTSPSSSSRTCLVGTLALFGVCVCSVMLVTLAALATPAAARGGAVADDGGGSLGGGS
jgi:hypothetical protein